MTEAVSERPVRGNSIEFVYNPTGEGNAQPHTPQKADTANQIIADYKHYLAKLPRHIPPYVASFIENIGGLLTRFQKLVTPPSLSAIISTENHKRFQPISVKLQQEKPSPLGNDYNNTEPSSATLDAIDQPQQNLSQTQKEFRRALALLSNAQTQQDREIAEGILAYLYDRAASKASKQEIPERSATEADWNAASKEITELKRKITELENAQRTQIENNLSLIEANQNLQGTIDLLTKETYIDPTTHLLGKKAVTLGIKDAVEMAKSGRGIGFVAFIDLDGFKKANEKYGHDMADNLLIVASRMISSAIRACDHAYHIQGDEFMITGQGEPMDVNDIISIGQRLLAAKPNKEDQALLDANKLPIPKMSYGFLVIDYDLAMRYSEQEIKQLADFACVCAKGRHTEITQETRNALDINLERCIQPNITQSRTELARDHSYSSIAFYRPADNGRGKIHITSIPNPDNPNEHPRASAVLLQKMRDPSICPDPASRRSRSEFSIARLNYHRAPR